ncbi:MAG: hypothetical protein AAFQ96_01615 [Pseudomonadota bacterium]
MKFFSIAAAAAIFMSSTAHATDFTFNISFDGSDVSIDAGSDVPEGASFEVGDTFALTFAATDDSFWRVLEDYSAFVPLSFATTEGAARTANIDTQFLLDGAVVNSTSEIATQSSFHIGAENFDLVSGLEFDTITLNWEFVSIDDPLVATIISFSSDIFNGFGQAGVAPFFRADDIAFITDAVVPLPGAAVLFGTALLGGAAARRRKKAA